MTNAFTNRILTSSGLKVLELPLLGLGLLIPSVLLFQHNQLRMLCTLAFLASLVALWHLNRSLAICANFYYLFLLGDIRRIVSMLAPSDGLDPLLVVGALFSVYAFITICGQIRLEDALSKVMMALLAIMLLEVVNPRQGGILVGFSAGLFYVIPIFWFWIARAYGTERLIMLLTFRVVIPLGVLAAALGLYQTFVGFLPWEQAWIATAIANGYNALYLNGGFIRPFGYSVNSVEYVTIMVVASAALLGGTFAGRRRYFLLLPVLATAIFYGSSRGAILRLLVCACVAWAVRGYKRNRKTWIPRFVFALVVGVTGVAYSVSQASSGDAGGGEYVTRSASASGHVVEGLAHPLDERNSTAGIHAGMFASGLASGVTDPIGRGLGFVTLAAGKFSGEGGGSTELDISDAFVTMGLPGGICFLCMIYFTFRYSFEYLAYGQAILSYTLVGLFASLLGSWLGQGQYAVAPFIFFCIGFLAKKHIERKNTLEVGERDDISSGINVVQTASVIGA